MSLREKIKAKKRKEERVTIDGDEYLIRGISELEGSKAESLATVDGKVEGGRLRREVLVRSIMDPEVGELVFDTNEVAELEELPRHITGPLFAIAMRLSGYSAEDSEDDTTKN